LHFVDAMKEATEINVQGTLHYFPKQNNILSVSPAHVEQFKKELTREVLVMTQDVGRLHKERQAIEQQIADLFAFYSKQKQSSPVCIHLFTGTPPVVKYTPLRNLPRDSTYGTYRIGQGDEITRPAGQYSEFKLY